MNYKNNYTYKKNNFNQAFTLVELLIVITILSILAIISFISFQGYISDTRDANRLTTLNNIDNGLQTFLLRVGSLPSVDNQSGTGIINGGLIVKSVWLKGIKFSHKGEKELV